MATFYSEQVAKLDAVPSEALNVDESHGKIRICRFDYDQVANGAENDIIQLVKLPAGRIRVLGSESFLYHSFAAGNIGLSLGVGWAAYKDFAGDAVAADEGGLDDAINCDPAGSVTIGSEVLAEGQSKVFESQEGVVITATVKVAIVTAGDSLKGHIAYVLD